MVIHSRVVGQLFTTALTIAMQATCFCVTAQEASKFSYVSHYLLQTIIVTGIVCFLRSLERTVECKVMLR